MRKSLYLYLLLALYILGSVTLEAAEVKITTDHYTKFRNITSLDGLSHNRILDIKQDAHGFIWIATGHGLNRYDGYQFKQYLHDANDSTSIPSNYVTSIAFDVNNRMWVGTKDGLASYKPSNESFELFSQHSELKSGISDSYVRRLFADSTEAILWVETIDGTLNQINLETFEMQHYKHQRVLASMYDYHEIFQDKDKCLWVGGRGFGPLRLNDKLKTFKKLPVDSKDASKKRDSDIACIFQDTDSLYWMSATDGFYQYFPSSNSFQKFLGTSTFDIIEQDCFNLWLATGSGLMKYHKYNDEYTSFRHDANNDHSLVHDHVNVLFSDKNDNLWVGTAKGLSILYKKKNTFTHYRHIPEVTTTMPNDYIRTFLELDNGKVWVGSIGGGVMEWDREEHTFTTVEGTEGERINSIFQDAFGDIWLGMWSGKGFLKYDNNKRISHYAYDYNSLKRDWYNDFYEDNKGRLWTGIWGAWGVHFFNRDRGEFEDYSLRLPESHTRTHLNKIALQGNRIWVHWTGNISHRYNPRTGQYEGWASLDTTDIVLPEWKRQHQYHFDANIKFKNINQIVETSDKDKSYWCTDDGLYIFSDGYHKIKFNKPFAIAYSVAEASDNSLYICTDRGVLHASDNLEYEHFLAISDTTIFTKVFTVNDSVVSLISDDEALLYQTKTDQVITPTLSREQLEIFCTTNDVLKDDSLYICTDKGLVVLNEHISSYHLYNMSNSFPEGLLSEKINGIIKGEEHVFWLATEKGLIQYNSMLSTFTLVEETLNIPIYDITRKSNTLWMATQDGLAHYSIEHERFVVIGNMTNHKLSSHLTSFINDDDDNNIWVGTTDKGVNILDKEHYNIHQFMPDESKEKAFWGEDATDFAMGKDGKVFISSNKGINIYQASDSTFSHITTTDGLPSNDVLGIAFDDDGLLWILTTNALAVYDQKQRSMRSFDDSWGLTPYLFSGDITFVEHEMLIPTDRGFYAFKPRELLRQKYYNTPGFTTLKVFSEEKESDLLENGQITLNYNENFFTISFSDFDFDESHSSFYYKLEGIDPNWVKTDQNYAAYTNIKFGNYTLLLHTEENYLAQLEPSSINVTITPPYWRKLWFVLLEVIVGLGLSYLFYLQRIKGFRIREKQLQTEQKLLRSQMNPHFVFNALIAIQSFIFKNEPKEAGRYLSKFAKLMRQFLQNTRQDYILLSQELETLEHYMELQRLRFDDAFDFSISCDESFDSEEIKLPPMMAQPFIENAIEHGFKGISYKGKIKVNYILKDEALEISIRDNGVGINKSSNNLKHKSLATVITRERLKSLSKRGHSYKLSIHDISDMTKNKTGTLVSLSVPYINSYTIG